MSGIDWTRIDAAAQSSIDQDRLATAIESGLSRGQEQFLRRLVLKWVLATALVIALTSAAFVARGATQSDQIEPVGVGRAASAVPPTSLPPAAGRTPSAPPSTSKPVQPRAVAPGSNPQAAASLTRFSITRRSFAAIRGACGWAVEIPSADEDKCVPAIARFVDDANPGCLHAPLCLEVYSVPGPAGLAGVGFLQVLDQTESPCDGPPSGICLRIGIPTTEALNTILDSSPAAEPADDAKLTPPTSTSTPAITPTTPTTPVSGDPEAAPPEGLASPPTPNP